MRIKLKGGYQKKLILVCKNKNNFSWNRLAKILKTGAAYLANELKNEKRTISEETYNQLCKLAKVDYDKCIVRRLDENWGRSIGGRNSSRKEKLVINDKSEKLAELIGIILGDGNIWEKGGGYHYINIAGNVEKDKDYLLNYVNPLFKELFGKEMHIKESKKDKGMHLYIGDKNIVFTLKNFGLKAGNKKINDIGIPKWVFEQEDYLKACVRGLVDTDGYVCPITGRNYPYIWFTSNIKNLRKTFSLAMKKLGIKTSKWNIRKNRSPDIYIGSKEMIKKYIETISFKNRRNLNKLTPLSFSGQTL